MFYFDNFYGKKILKSSYLENYDCFFTTRDFVLTSLELKEFENESQKNRNLLCEKLDVKEIITAKQIHGDNIEIIEKNRNFYNNTDALISSIENTLILLNFADCVPIILYSKKDNTGAVIHAGWRGTVLEIAKKSVQKMNKELGIKSENITALIGPSIGKCCFETDEEVFDKIIKNKAETDLYRKSGEKYYIDLKLLNYKQLNSVEIRDIDMCPYCTFCMSDIFFSYRREKGKTARHSAVVKIKGEKTCQ